MKKGKNQNAAAVAADEQFHDSVADCVTRREACKAPVSLMNDCPVQRCLNASEIHL